MYTKYWGFKEKPFENTPDTKFFYLSSKHEEAFQRMLYAITEFKGAAMLSGEYGSGKTLLCRMIASRLMNDDDKYQEAFIINPSIPAVELLGEILYQLGGEVLKDDRKIDILHKLNEIFYRVMDNNKHTVIIVDEAQAINDESVFEELRLLLNFQAENRFLLTLLLVGQPELKEKIEGIRQLEQRLSIRYHLESLNELETRDYVRHRCRVAGKEQHIFSGEAYKVIYEASAGIPREINNICDLSLVVGFGEKATHINEDIVRNVVMDLSKNIK